MSLLPHSWSKQTMRHEARGGFVDSFFKEMELPSSVTNSENRRRCGKLRPFWQTIFQASHGHWLVAVTPLSGLESLTCLIVSLWLRCPSVLGKLLQFSFTLLLWTPLLSLVLYGLQDIYDYSCSLPDWYPPLLTPAYIHKLILTASSVKRWLFVSGVNPAEICPEKLIPFPQTPGTRIWSLAFTDFKIRICVFMTC